MYWSNQFLNHPQTFIGVNLFPAMQQIKRSTKLQQPCHKKPKTYWEMQKNKILDNDKLRSFSSFVGKGEQSAFSFTVQPGILCPILKKNILCFYLNYILIAAIVMVITLLATILPTFHSMKALMVEMLRVTQQIKSLKHIELCYLLLMHVLCFASYDANTMLCCPCNMLWLVQCALRLKVVYQSVMLGSEI